MTTFRALKAHPIDDDAFRLLAIPFGGPIGKPGTSRYIKGLEQGYDMDQQAFDETTDIKPHWFHTRLVDWHHRYDRDPGSMHGQIVGKAVDLGNRDGPSDEPDEDGWWTTFWLSQGAKRRGLIRQMAKASDPDTGEPILYGSSEAFEGTGRLRLLNGREVPWRPSTPGTITVWPYAKQTITTSPQNTLSVLVPLKATVDDLYAEGEPPTAAFFSDLERLLDNLTGPDSDLAGEETAKAGRVLAARNEERLREGMAALDERGWDPVVRARALSKIAEVLDELTRYVQQEEP